MNLDFSLSTSEVISLLLLIVSIITFMLSRLNYRASHAPIIAIQNRKYRISNGEKKNTFTITVKNIGNGVCIDSFLLLREKGKDTRINYYLSEPIREINSEEVIEFTVSKGPDWDENAEFLLVYVDYFGKKYTSNGVTEGEAAPNIDDHLRFVQPAKQLWMLHPTYLKFLWWRYKAIQQGNTHKVQGKTDYDKFQKGNPESKIKINIFMESEEERFRE
ncbi:hypothetical protein [Halobacillus sp. Marseille-P3879]|uniref:hypothetical protein n=1 Tax=Halobacillus sp. Marseille-P3879 TaxID=2045014 RepID=UPI000C7CF5A0|nr:hypothetical protein [Halobacillus sp. Marseille-P3879]